MPNENTSHLDVVFKTPFPCVPGGSAGKESACNAGDPSSIPGLERSSGEGMGLPTPVFLGFPGGSAGKESTCSAKYLGLIPGLGRSPREGNGYLLQYFGLKNSMDCIVRGVAKSWTRLSNFCFLSSGFGRTVCILLGFPNGPRAKEPACQCRRHKIHWLDPWVRKIPWRRAWQPTPVFLPGDSP